MANNRHTKNKRVTQNLVDASRQKQNTKRKKTNLVLNILIVIVTLLIILSLYFVLFTTDKKEHNNPSNTKTASSMKHKEDADNVSKKKKAAKKKTTVEKSDDPNVSKVIKKDWKPVKTEQTGEHVNSYVSTTVDWKEKLDASSKGAGISRDDMTVWFVEQGDDPATQAITTVSKKETPDKAYRVYLTWKNQQGWAPTKVEVLKTNDKR